MGVTCYKVTYVIGCMAEYEEDKGKNGYLLKI